MAAKYEDKKKQVMVGKLPDDFLRVSSNESHQTQPTVAARSNQLPSWNYSNTNVIGQISVCIIQAHLVKNYGLTKMNPYVRIRIGHTVYESQADSHGGKNPRWNKTYSAYLLKGIKSIYLEIFDENMLTPDERIAWTEIIIPEEVFTGKVYEGSVPLSGQQGEDLEGTLHFSMYLTPLNMLNTQQMVYSPVMVMPQTIPTHVPYMPYNMTGHQTVMQYPLVQQPMQMAPPQVHRQVYTPNNEDIKQLQEMFPTYDKEIIVSILQCNGGNKDQAVTALLNMESEK